MYSCGTAELAQLKLWTVPAVPVRYWRHPILAWWLLQQGIWGGGEVGERCDSGGVTCRTLMLQSLLAVLLTPAATLSAVLIPNLRVTESPGSLPVSGWGGRTLVGITICPDVVELKN